MKAPSVLDRAASAVDRFLKARPKAVVAAGCAALVLLIGWGDYKLGADVSLIAFYWVPVTLAAWYLDPAKGVIAALASMAAHFGGDKLAGRVWLSQRHLAWDVLMESVGFLVFAAVLSRLRHAYERETAHLRDVERAAALKSEIISFVSHEIANSVTVAKMATHLIKEDRRQSLDMLERSLENMEITTNNFLNEARMESGKLKLRPLPMPLRPIVEKSARMFEGLAREKQLNVLVDVPTYEVFAVADEAALALVLNNLVGNAVKYTPQRGHVAVRAALEGAPPGSIRLSVQDSGIGIPADDLRRITEGFVRLPQGKVMARGFGLGLKVAWDMLKLHGAELQIESEPGKGSRFFFDLPLAG